MSVQGKSFNFYVHDDGHYASVNDEIGSPDTLLRIGGQPGKPGVRDVARVREFEGWLRGVRQRERDIQPLLDAARKVQAALIKARLEPADIFGPSESLEEALEPFSTQPEEEQG